MNKNEKSFLITEETQKRKLDGLPIYIQQMDFDIDIKRRIIYMPEVVDATTPAFIQKSINAICDVSKDETSPITLQISCYGGDAYAMYGVVDIIKMAKVKINTLGVGPIMSAAATILASGTGSRQLTKAATVMIHQVATSGVGGSLDDIEVETKQMIVLQNKLFEVLENVTNKDKTFWKEQIKTNLYFSAEVCKQYGIIDEII